MLTHRIIKVKPVATPIPQYGGYLTQQKKPPINQEELNRKLALIDLNVGDFCSFIKPDADRSPQSDRCTVVIDICVEVKDLEYNQWGDPLPVLLMGLNGTSTLARRPEWKYNTEPWVRWDNGSSLYVLSDSQRQEVNDDFVQNYIKNHLNFRDKYLGK
jgi:hypothetical protein